MTGKKRRYLTSPEHLDLWGMDAIQHLHDMQGHHRMEGTSIYTHLSHALHAGLHWELDGNIARTYPSKLSRVGGTPTQLVLSHEATA